MSLLDDVSIVVTPNGYKAGELYAVVPVPTLGADVIVDGNFPNGSTNWSGQGDIINNEMVLDCTSNPNASAYQSKTPAYTLGRTFQVTVTIISNTTGAALLLYPFSNSPYVDSITIGTIAGTYTFNFVSDYVSGTGKTFVFRVLSSTGTLVIDNVSVKEYTAADMDVTRATAATRVDENGLVNYAEILGSEEVTNGDFTNGLTGFSTQIPSGQTVEVTSNQLHVDYDSTATQGSTGVNQTILTAGKQYKITIDVASITGTFRVQAGGQVQDINTSGIHTFYKTPTSSILYIIRQSNAASCEFRLNSVSVKEVTRDNVPRIDYTGGGCPHILAEPQRTNLYVNSEPTVNEGFEQNTSYESFSWANGFTNCVKFGDNSVLRARYGATVPASTEVTLSCFVIMDDLSEPSISNNSTLGDFSIVVGGGASTGVNANVSMGNNIWKISKTDTSGTSNLGNNGIVKYTTQSSKGFKVVGWQLEVGSYGTSYIPNFGTALGVTRNQDIFTRDGIGSLINDSEGVLFAEISALSNDASYRYMGLTDGSSDNRVVILYYNSNNRIRVLLSSGGTKYFDAYYAVTSIEDFHKVALKWKENDFALWIDGVERATDTSGSAPIGLNTLALDQAGGDNFYGKVKQLQVYNTALDDATLTSLTSL